MQLNVRAEAMIDARIDEIYSNKTYAHFDVFFSSFTTPVGTKSVKCKFYMSSDDVGLEFRNAHGWPNPFCELRWDEKDEFGEKYRLSASTLDAKWTELKEVDRQVMLGISHAFVDVISACEPDTEDKCKLKNLMVKSSLDFRSRILALIPEMVAYGAVCDSDLAQVETATTVGSDSLESSLPEGGRHSYLDDEAVVADFAQGVAETSLVGGESEATVRAAGRARLVNEELPAARPCAFSSEIAAAYSDLSRTDSPSIDQSKLVEKSIVLTARKIINKCGSQDFDLVFDQKYTSIWVIVRPHMGVIVWNTQRDGVWGAEQPLAFFPKDYSDLVIDVQISGTDLLVFANHQFVGAIPFGSSSDEVLVPRSDLFVFERSKTSLALPLDRSFPVGFVNINDDIISGWVQPHVARAPITIKGLSFIHSADATWSSRDPSRPEFHLDVRSVPMEALGVSKGSDWSQLCLLVGGAKLSWAPPALIAWVTYFDQFRLVGEFSLSCGEAPSITLTCCGELVDEAPIVWRESAESRWKFEFFIPGTVWDSLLNQDLVFSLRVTGSSCETDEVALTRSTAKKWLSAIPAAGTDTREGQRTTLSAIEHIKHGRFFGDLPKSIKSYFHNFAAHAGLGAYVSSLDEEFHKDLMYLPQSIDLRVIHVNAVLMDINNRLQRCGAPIAAIAKEVILDWGMSAEESLDVYQYLLPALCVNDELDTIRSSVNLRYYLQLRNSGDLWGLSTAVGVLMSEGEIGAATDVLYEINDAKCGWLNSASIGYGIRKCAQLEAQGVVAVAQAEKFRYAFLSLLDVLSSDYFSRLHDLELVRAMVFMLDSNYPCKDYYYKDVVDAAIRVYGMSPVFWELLGGLENTSGEVLKALLVAKSHFNNLMEALSSGFSLEKEADRVVESLNFFIIRKSNDALWAAREFIIRVIADANSRLSAPVLPLLKNMLVFNQKDAIRIISNPGWSGAIHIDELGLSSEQMFSLLRKQNPNATSLTRSVQQALAAQIETIGGDRYNQIAGSFANLLMDETSGYLGLDALSSMAVRSSEGREGANPPLAKFARIATNLMMRADPEVPLPAALISGLSRLNRFGREQGDPMIVAVVDELRREMELRFGDFYRSVIDVVERPLIRPTASSMAGDVIVVLYSCKPYLDTRVAAIRATWLQDLVDRKIPYVIMTGGGAGELNGDTLELNVSDLYEDLPSKTLNLIEWVYRNTNAQYMVKIDDDCYLDVDNYFGDLEFRAHHYYGRKLYRNAGETDRVWHLDKSTTARGRRIDRSPEPSCYADGGGAYSLSRFAMASIIAAASTAEGQRLRAVSFMEDKLVGDLLALCKIKPSDREYGSYQRRRTHPSAMPVGMWENTFFPSRIAPAKVAHLDDDKSQKMAHEIRDEVVLRPMKIWPCSIEVSMGRSAPQLELITTLDSLKSIDRHGPGVVMVMRNELTMLPHFLNYYRNLGVRAFYVVDNLSTDGSREYLISQDDVVLYSAASEYKYSHFGVAWQIALLGQHFLGRWALLADADELLICPGLQQRGIADLCAKTESDGANAVPVYMVDMYPFARLDDADFDIESPFKAAPFMDRNPVRPWHLSSGYFSNRSAMVSTFRHRLLPNSPPESFTAEKIALLKYAPWMRLAEGLHSAANVTLSKNHAAFAHFKYHKGFQDKVWEEIARKQHFNDAAEYRRYAALIAEAGGVLGVVGESVRFDDDQGLSRILNGGLDAQGCSVP